MPISGRTDEAIATSTSRSRPIPGSRRLFGRERGIDLPGESRARSIAAGLTPVINPDCSASPPSVVRRRARRPSKAPTLPSKTSSPLTMPAVSVPPLSARCRTTSRPPERIRWVQQGRPVTVGLLCDLHRTLVRARWPMFEEAGRIRRIQVVIAAAVGASPMRDSPMQEERSSSPACRSDDVDADRSRRSGSARGSGNDPLSVRDASPLQRRQRSHRTTPHRPPLVGLGLLSKVSQCLPRFEKRRDTYQDLLARVSATVSGTSGSRSSRTVSKRQPSTRGAIRRLLELQTRTTRGSATRGLEVRSETSRICSSVART